MIYEERHIRLHPGALQDYTRWALETLWPALRAAGHEPLVLLNGMIGLSTLDVVWFTGHADPAAWQAAQPLLAGGTREGPPRGWVAQETARLLLPSAARPALPLTAAQRRPVYGLRRWFIAPEDWEEYNRLSVEGVWPALDHMGHYTIGQFRNAATTSPLEVVNLAGYDDPAMWQATRDPTAAGVPESLARPYREMIRTRRTMVTDSYVCLMAAHWPDGD